jgi:hypothetical protein
MQATRTLALAGFAMLIWTGSPSARVQSQMYCWAPDAELPVLCEEEAGEDETGVQGLGSRLQDQAARNLIPENLIPETWT